MRFMPFVKGKKGFQMAGGGVSDSGGGGGGYVLPPATSNTLGGVKIGNGVNVTSDGTISVSGGGGGGFDYSTTEEVNTGHKWIDGKTIYCKTYFIPSQVNLNSNEATTVFSDNNLKNVDTGIDCTITASSNDIYKRVFPYGSKRYEINKYAGTFQALTTSGTDFIWANTWIILYYTKKS